MRAKSRQQLRIQALLAQRAEFMRHNSTESEQTLWRQLSGSKLGVAFPCRVVADARRDRVLLRLGYRVLRLDAELVLRQLPLAVEAVREALQGLSSRGAP